MSMRRARHALFVGGGFILALVLAVAFLPLRAIAGLESPCNFISDLVITNPLSSDLASTSDDHHRCIKSAVKGSFPNINAAVNATDENLNALSATLTAAGILELEAAAPRLIADETDAASNERIYDFASSAGQLLGRTRTDADGAGASWLTVDRTGATVDSIALAATAITLNSVAATDFARLSQTNTFLQSLNGTTSQVNRNSSAGAAANAQLVVLNDASRGAGLAVTSSGFSGALITGGPSGESLALYGSGSLPISIATNTTERVRIAGDGSVINLQATAVQINGSEVVRSSAGTYAPTATAELNLDSVTASTAQYLRVGNTVTVSGEITIDPTLVTTATTFRLSLPVSSNIGATTQCGGAGAQNYTGVPAMLIRGDSTNDACQFIFTSGGTASATAYYSFTYLVN